MEQTITVTAICEVCDRPFLYEVKVGDETVVSHGAVVGFRRRGVFIPINPRQMCPGCARRRLLDSKQRYRQRHRIKPGMKLAGRPSAKGNITGAIKHSHSEIARALRIKTHEVERLERQVLLKIRNNPELKKLWASVKEEGVLSAAQLFDGAMVSDPSERGMRLLEYQLGIVEFWEAHDKLVAEMARTGQDCAAEAAECLAEIKKLQQQIAASMKKI